jgi:hypothetical protein
MSGQFERRYTCEFFLHDAVSRDQGIRDSAFSEPTIGNKHRIQDHFGVEFRTT